MYCTIVIEISEKLKEKKKCELRDFIIATYEIK